MHLTYFLLEILAYVITPTYIFYGICRLVSKFRKTIILDFFCFLISNVPKMLPLWIFGTKTLKPTDLKCSSSFVLSKIVRPHSESILNLNRFIGRLLQIFITFISLPIHVLGHFLKSSIWVQVYILVFQPYVFKCIFQSIF